MFDIQTASIVVASAGVCAAAIYYIFQVRYQNKVRQTDLLMRLYSQVSNKETMDAILKVRNLKVNDYGGFTEKYGSLGAEGPEQSAFFLIAMLMEGLGFLLHRKLVDVDVARELFPVEYYWRMCEPIIVGWRKEEAGSNAHKWFEYLYYEVEKREQQLQTKKS